ncbi:MAG: hypothetical protein IPP49_14110 [Saprospiraceae bacterium]|nr:hypothetical protein [Saprospiraceae bacterium]
MTPIVNCTNIFIYNRNEFLYYLRDKTVAGAFSNKMVLGEPIKPDGNKIELYDIPDKKLIGHFDINFKVGAGIINNENYIVVPCYKIGDEICWKSYVLSMKDLSIMMLLMIVILQNK